MLTFVRKCRNIPILQNLAHPAGFCRFWTLFLTGAPFGAPFSYLGFSMALTRIEEWKGRIITYGGSGGISLYNEKAIAKAQEAAEVVANNSELFTERLISSIGLFLIACRLVFEIFAFFDQRRLKKLREQSDDRATNQEL
ncbi:TPA: hypothetical protein ACGUPM_002671 [Vibrio vulnificus]